MPIGFLRACLILRRALINNIEVETLPQNAFKSNKPTPLLHGVGFLHRAPLSLTEPQTTIELAPEGTGYRARARLAKFHNLPELMSMFRDFADIQTADMLDLPTPEVKYENIILESSGLQKDMVQQLSERALLVQRRLVDPKTDNMLKITTDGRKIGLDQRLINPLLPESENSKSNACADNVFATWEETKSKSLIQLGLCEIGLISQEKRYSFMLCRFSMFGRVLGLFCCG